MKNIQMHMSSLLQPMHTHPNMLLVCTNFRIFYCALRISKEQKYNSNDFASL